MARVGESPVEFTEESIFTCMKVKDLDEPPVPSVKKICSGGCGDMVWVDNRLEYVWSNVPILCLDCSIEKWLSSIEKTSFHVLPESLESLFQYYLEKRKRARVGDGK